MLSIWFLLISCVSVTYSMDIETHRLDPAIPTVSPHTNETSPDSCVGQCAFAFMDNIRAQVGQDKAASLIKLDYNEFLNSFANTTFFETFCSIHHSFQHCASQCTPGYLHQLLMRSAEIIDHYCVYNFDAIRAKFPCLAKVKPNKDCVKTCTPHHDNISTLVNNFKNLALSGDTSKAEQYLAQGCEYVTCTLHCDVPAIAHTCDFDTANLVIDLTRKSFTSMEKMALDTNAVSKWPQVCSDIKTYRMPTPSTPPKSNSIVAQSSDAPHEQQQVPPHPKMIQAPVINNNAINFSILLVSILPFFF